MDLKGRVSWGTREAGKGRDGPGVDKGRIRQRDSRQEELVLSTSWGVGLGVAGEGAENRL